jgi:hypothetical protein
MEGLFATHPPSEERVVANQTSVDQYPQGGYIGEKEYKKAIKHSIKKGINISKNIKNKY